MFQTSPQSMVSGQKVELIIPLLSVILTRVARGWSQSDKKKNKTVFLPLTALGNESPKEFLFGVLEDLSQD